MAGCDIIPSGDGSQRVTMASKNTLTGPVGNGCIICGWFRDVRVTMASMGTRTGGGN